MKSKKALLEAAALQVLKAPPDDHDRLGQVIDFVTAQKVKSAPTVTPSQPVKYQPKRKPQPLIRPLELKEGVSIKERYHKVPNDFHDRLARTQTMAEEIVYSHMLRLSYGWGRNYCQVGPSYFLENSSIRSTRTVKTALYGLLEKGHIAEYTKSNKPKSDRRGSIYVVFLPDEVLDTEPGDSGSSGVNSTRVNSTHVNSTRVNSTHVNSTRVNSTHVNSTRVNSTHVNSTRVNSTHVNSTRVDSTQEEKSTHVKFTRVIPVTHEDYLASAARGGKEDFPAEQSAQRRGGEENCI